MQKTANGKKAQPLKMLIIGKPLANPESSNRDEHKLGLHDGIPTAGADSTSAATYGYEAMLSGAGGIAMLGVSAYFFGIVVTFAIIATLALTVLCYKWGIAAYPRGGGAYKIAKDNFPSTLIARIAGSSLLTNYSLTVCVSFAALVDQLISILPWINPSFEVTIWIVDFSLEPIRVMLNIFVIALTCIVNLRGPKSAGKPVAVFYYYFLGIMATVFCLGFIRLFIGNLPVSNKAHLIVTTTADPSFLFILTVVAISFVLNSVSLTGTEAPSAEVAICKSPQEQTAIKILLFLGGLLAILLGCIALFAIYIHPVAVSVSQPETVVSQIVEAITRDINISAFGVTIPLGYVVYLLAQLGSIAILYLGGNTPYTAFPNQLKFMAEDGFVHRQLTGLGPRLELRGGIIVLTITSTVLTIVFQANTLHLLSCYGVGVFIGYIFYEFGMARFFLKSQDKHKRLKVITNIIAGSISVVLTLGFLVVNFKEGAWVALLLIAGIVWFSYGAKKHYDTVADSLTIVRNGAKDSLAEYCKPPKVVYLALISGAHKSALDILRIAKSGAESHQTKLHVVYLDDDPEKGDQIVSDWETLVLPIMGIPLERVPVTYRQMENPLTEYVERLHMTYPGFVINVVCGELAASNKFAKSFHRNSTQIIKKALEELDDYIITTVPHKLP